VLSWDGAPDPVSTGADKCRPVCCDGVLQSGIHWFVSQSAKLGLVVEPAGEHIGQEHAANSTSIRGADCKKHARRLDPPLTGFFRKQLRGKLRLITVSLRARRAPATLLCAAEPYAIRHGRTCTSSKLPERLATIYGAKQVNASLDSFPLIPPAGLRSACKYAVLEGSRWPSQPWIASGEFPRSAKRVRRNASTRACGLSRGECGNPQYVSFNDRPNSSEPFRPAGGEHRIGHRATFPQPPRRREPPPPPDL